ncbi:UNVERIFIED_CONTAM: protein RRP6-like 2 [Sesamum calycinum]|uniref:Protein RRP6-like 2 n=1 Tax=Sesamum calycinum TaxID=2727403 RepID=A0AAW2J376_9LAMI
MHRFHLIMSRGFRNNCALCQGQGEARSCVHWLWLKLVIPWLGELRWSRFDEIVSVADPFPLLGWEMALKNIGESWASYKTSISNNKQYRYFLNADDVEEEPLHSAVMLEQASYCFLLSTPTMSRKYGFHLVLSGDLYRKCDQVDLEHNQYRSFQGLTCLMQISTRTEDFIIDTPRLRVQIGPHLREVLHGADRDIVWLQRDFGIYVCNMFDTGQSVSFCDSYPYVRYLCVCTSLEGIENGKAQLEYLLNHFCGVVANREYQNADWRIRPLPQEMIKYVFYSKSCLLLGQGGARSCVHWLWLKLVIPWLGELWWSRFDEIVSVADPFPLLGWRGIWNSAEMRSTFGANDCRLLCINSSSDGAENIERIYGHLIKLAFQTTSSKVGSTIHDFSAKHIIPLMELKIGVLNQQISARRRGFRNLIRNLWWRKGKDDAPEHSPFSMGLIAQATVASSSYIDRLSLDDDVPWRRAIWLRC